MLGVGWWGVCGWLGRGTQPVQERDGSCIWVGIVTFRCEPSLQEPLWSLVNRCSHSLGLRCNQNRIPICGSFVDMQSSQNI